MKHLLPKYTRTKCAAIKEHIDHFTSTRHSKLFYTAILGTILLAAGCNEDSGSGSCGLHEKDNNGECVCDSSANYYGTAGSCTLCDGEHKIVKENKCVCDTNYEDDQNGGCKQKTSSLTCNDHEKESGDECICDNDKNYYGTAGSCTLCDGEHKIVKENKCVCDTDYEDDQNGGCKLKTSSLTCGEHETESEGECICDNNKNYYGTAGSCTLCDGEHKIVKENECVCENGATESDGTCACDAKNGWIQDDSGSCTCDTEFHWVPDGENGCTCDAANHFVYGCDFGNPDTYHHIPKTQTCSETIDGQTYNGYAGCICENGWVWAEDYKSCKCSPLLGRVLIGDSCLCDFKNGFIQSEKGGCMCNADKHWKGGVGSGCTCENGLTPDGNGGCKCSDGNYLKDGQCVPCDGTVFQDNCINETNRVVTFGKYLQSNETDKEQLMWFPLEIDTAQRRIMLISRYVIDAHSYHVADSHNILENKDGLAWSKSQLRTWLNNEFFNEAFDAYDQSLILTTHMDNPNEGSTLTQATDDKVFLLNYDEFKEAKTFGNPIETGVTTSHAIKAGLNNELYILLENKTPDQCPNLTCFSRQWTRSCSMCSNTIPADWKTDSIHNFDSSKIRDVKEILGIRPVIWVKY